MMSWIDRYVGHILVTFLALMFVGFAAVFIVMALDDSPPTTRCVESDTIIVCTTQMVGKSLQTHCGPRTRCLRYEYRECTELAEQDLDQETVWDCGPWHN